MSTHLQADIATELIKDFKKPANKRRNKTELLESVGYAESTARTEQKRVLESKGVQYELKKRGFTIENAQKVISEIMLDENQEARDRLKGAELTLKAHHVFTDGVDQRTIVVQLSNEATSKYSVERVSN